MIDLDHTTKAVVAVMRSAGVVVADGYGQRQPAGVSKAGDPRIASAALSVGRVWDLSIEPREEMAMTEKQKIGSLQDKALTMAKLGNYPNAQAIRVRLWKDHPRALVSKAIGPVADEDGYDFSFAYQLDDYCRQRSEGADTK